MFGSIVAVFCYIQTRKNLITISGTKKSEDERMIVVSDKESSRLYQ